MSNTPITNPKAIAELGEKIYREKYKKEFEELYSGQFVVIDVKSGDAYRGETPEEAYELAKQHADHGFFHLIKVGSAGAFRVSYSAPNGNVDWIFR